MQNGIENNYKLGKISAVRCDEELSKVTLSTPIEIDPLIVDLFDLLLEWERKNDKK